MDHPFLHRGGGGRGDAGGAERRETRKPRAREGSGIEFQVGPQDWMKLEAGECGGSLLLGISSLPHRGTSPCILRSLA